MGRNDWKEAYKNSWPLSPKVKSLEPLWFRPDKIDNAIINSQHDTFLVHNCASDDTRRVIHIDKSFAERYCAGEFRIVTPCIRGRQERYVEIRLRIAVSVI